MRAKITTRDYEQISAYLDEQMSPSERTHLEERMRVHPEMHAAMEDLGRTRALLRMAPRYRAPRNFTLTRSMVQPRPETKRGIFSLFPVLSFTSAVATFALVITILFEFSPYLNTSSRSFAPTIEPLPTTAAVQSIGPNTTSQLNNPSNPAAAAPIEPTPSTGVQSSAPSANNAAGAEQSNPNAAPAITCCMPPGVQVGNEPPYFLGPGGLATGKGGGPLGMGGGGETNTFVLPSQAVNSLPPSLSSQANPGSAAPDQFSDVPTLQGKGPILGAPQADKAGKYVAALPTPMATPTRPAPTSTLELTSQQPTLPASTAAPQVITDNQAEQQPGQAAGSLPGLFVLQVLLGAIALITALVAVLVWRRGR